MHADWVKLGEAIETVLTAVEPLGAERCRLDRAAGRVLAEDIASPVDLPLWPNSGMDGFAVRAQDVHGAAKEAGITLPVTQDISAGSFPTGPLIPGTAARIMTGAPLPDGADSVVRVEDTDGGTGIGSTEARVIIRDDRDAGRNLRRRGEEIEQGAVALRAGSLLDPGAIGVAASLGRAELSVVRRPLVALLASGDELVDLDGFDQVLAGRRIVSSNTYTLATQLSEAGCDVRHLGIAPDSPEAIAAALSDAVGCDALITSAGISVGEHDHVRRVLLELGTDVLFWRVRIRPGSPFGFGRVGGLGGIPWFGLPGNPVSSMVTFELFARPALLRMAGHPRVFRRTLRAVMMDDHPSPQGLTHLLRVRFEPTDDGDLGAYLAGPQGSGILRSMAAVDGLLLVPEGEAGARRGATYDVIPLSAGNSTAEPGF